MLVISALQSQKKIISGHVGQRQQPTCTRQVGRGFEEPRDAGVNGSSAHGAQPTLQACSYEACDFSSHRTRKSHQTPNGEVHAEHQQRLGFCHPQLKTSKTNEARMKQSNEANGLTRHGPDVQTKDLTLSLDLVLSEC